MNLDDEADCDDHASMDAPLSKDLDALSATVGRNVRDLRLKRNLSLGAVGRLAGVSRAMVGQIECCRSVPTIALLWKIARALEVPFSALITDTSTAGPIILPADKAKILSSADGSFKSRALFPLTGERKVEFYRLSLAAACVEHAEPHPAGTLENLAVEHGEVEISIGGATHRLQAGDAIMFEADVPHSYGNAGGEEAIMFLVMVYA